MRQRGELVAALVMAAFFVAVVVFLLWVMLHPYPQL